MLKPIKDCRSCAMGELIPILDLGKQRISDFRADNSRPPSYPLEVVICSNCKLVQLKHSTPQPEMYHDNYGFKSGINEVIKADLDDVVLHAFQYVNDPRSWLDIASNDGTLLSFVPENVERVGVDPVPFLCEEALPHADRIINDYFDAGYFHYYDGSHGSLTKEQFDVITSISCFYDMPDPQQFVSEVKSVLAKQGVWIIQQNYLLTSIRLNAVDNFCHEHLEYYSLLSLEHLLRRFGLEVIEVRLSGINGGSIRTVVAHKGMYSIDSSVYKQRVIERDFGLTDLTVYADFADSMAWELSKLRRLVGDLHDDGRELAILAASTRGATIWQSAGIDSQQIAYAIERNPAKVGKYFSAIGVPIISEEEARKRNPFAMIVGPWFFGEQIIKREHGYIAQGGKLIIPLPEVMIVDKDGR